MTEKLFLPLMLDVTALPVMVTGGAGILSRLAALDEHGARHVRVFAPDPSPDLIAMAGGRLQKRWPTDADFADMRPRLLFAADMDDALAAELCARGRAAGALVHVQDRLALCDFHMPALVRRGHLQVTVSTDGEVPGLSRHIREYLESQVFGPEWSDRVRELAAARRRWKAEGLSPSALARAIADLVAARRWLGKP